MPHIRSARERRAMFRRMKGITSKSKLTSQMIVNNNRFVKVRDVLGTEVFLDTKTGKEIVITNQKNPDKPKKTLFFAPRDPRLARIIKIDTPQNFRRSIRILSKGGLTLKERRSLVLARNRATAQLGRKNLSRKERMEFREISRTEIPPTPTRVRRLTRTDPFKAVIRRKELKREKRLIRGVVTLSILGAVLKKKK